MICMYRDVVSSVQVLVPLFHARDNCDTLFFNLSIFLLVAVQCVRCEANRLMVLSQCASDFIFRRIHLQSYGNSRVVAA